MKIKGAVTEEFDPVIHKIVYFNKFIGSFVPLKMDSWDVQVVLPKYDTLYTRKFVYSKKKSRWLCPIDLWNAKNRSSEYLEIEIYLNKQDLEEKIAYDTIQKLSQ